MTMREALVGDITAIAEMRESAGWAVHEWALHAVIDQPHARCVVMTDADGRPAAVGSGIAYGALGFIGNMVVVEAHRRQGLGSAILDDVAGWLEASGCTRLELNATEDGAHLYRLHGFASRGTSWPARVPRTAALARDGSVGIRPASSADLQEMAEYDRPRFGGDRRPILAQLLHDPACSAAIAVRDGQLDGFAFLRPDEARLGPVVADDPGAAGALLTWAFNEVPSAEALRLNLPPGNAAGAAWLGDAGAEVDEWNGRMARGPDLPRRDETIYQMTVGPLG